MSRHSMPYLTLAILGIFTLAAIFISLSMVVPAHVASTTTHHARGSGNPFGAPEYGFGGYSISERTSEIGAQWKVPALDPQSSEGNASTWIAVQNNERQFIQLGTLEDKVNGISKYEIFWSDVAVGFHPVQLLEVNAGDFIKFSMTQKSGGWRLGFDDVTEKAHEAITIPYARGALFDTAQWLQEDPTFEGFAAHLPYPTIGLTTFSHLTVNKLAPTLETYEAQVLSTADGVYLIPTAPKNDQFTFINATGPARQYLADVFAYDEYLYPLQVDVFYNRPVRTIVLQHLRSALITLELKLGTQTWPTSVASAVKGDAKLVADYEYEFNNFPAAPLRISEKTLARYHATQQRDEHFSSILRHDLGLPPIQ